MKLNKIFLIAMLSGVVMSGCQNDDDPEVHATVISTEPDNGDTGVAFNRMVTATFGEAMNETTLTSSTFTLKQGSTAIAGTVARIGASATFSPDSDLEPNKTYTATITTGAKDINGNGLAADHSFSFTTGASADLVSPTISLSDPLANATGIARNKEIVLTFSETMDPLTLNSSTFSLTQGTTEISGEVMCSGTAMTFVPTSFLTAGLEYTATITTGAKDLAANALASNTAWSFTTGGSLAALEVVNLGEAGDYAILAKTAINNSSTSAITGDLGLSPAATSYVTGLALTDATGYATSAQVTGKIYAANMADPTPINLTTAINNMTTAYSDAAGRPSPDFSELASGNMGGKTLVPGLYKWSNTVTVPTDVILSGSATDVWIFQIAGNLTMSANMKITLTGGAQAKNIFWQVAGQATFGTNSHMEGIILSKTGITFQTSSTLTGRALAQTAVILDKNTITTP